MLHVITGWPIPEKEYRDIFMNQLEKKLIEDYGYLNFAELELAFRQNPGLRSFGASMNLSLITEVLNDFKVIRLDVVKNASLASANALKIDSMTDEQMINKARGEIEYYYQQRRKGNTRPITFPFWAEVLAHDRFIGAEDQMDAFFTYCLDKNVPKIYEDVHHF